MINDRIDLPRARFIAMVHDNLLQKCDFFTWIHKEPMIETVPHGL